MALIEQAREQQRRFLLVLTGVPGSGKTLAGLHVVHSAVAPRVERYGDIVYLSGNTPLVVVLREALARDEYLRSRLVKLGQAKTAHYPTSKITAAHDACKRVVKLMSKGRVEPCAVPPLHNIDRWWNPAALDSLRMLRAGIDAETKSNSAEHTLLLIAFCRTLIGLSNVAFNHQSMGFKDDRQMTFSLDCDTGEIFENDVSFVLSGAANNPKGSATVILGLAQSDCECGRYV